MKLYISMSSGLFRLYHITHIICASLQNGDFKNSWLQTLNNNSNKPNGSLKLKFEFFTD